MPDSLAMIDLKGPVWLAGLKPSLLSKSTGRGLPFTLQPSEFARRPQHASHIRFLDSNCGRYVPKPVLTRILSCSLLRNCGDSLRESPSPSLPSRSNGPCSEGTPSHRDSAT